MNFTACISLKNLDHLAKYVIIVELITNKEWTYKFPRYVIIAIDLSRSTFYLQLKAIKMYSIHRFEFIVLYTTRFISKSKISESWYCGRGCVHAFDQIGDTYKIQKGYCT